MELIKNHISATLNEGVIASVLPVSKTTKNVNKSLNKRSLENIIKLQPNEEIMSVQRQHIITLLPPFLSMCIIFALFLTGVLAVEYQSYLSIPKLPTLDLMLVVACFLTTFGIFSYLYWYYQFYIITNKAILHRHFFRMGGYHSEEVFLETSPEREITRKSSNFIYSLLDIEDVQVSFQRPGLGEFIFIAPENAHEIEDTLETVTMNK